MISVAGLRKEGVKRDDVLVRIALLMEVEGKVSLQTQIL